MAQNLQEYYKRIRGVAEQLVCGADDEVDLISLDNPERATKEGVVTRAQRHLAAKCVVDRTHRLATPEEVAAAKAAAQVRLDSYAEKDKKRAPLEVVADRLSRVLENQEADKAKATRSA